MPTMKDMIDIAIMKYYFLSNSIPIDCICSLFGSYPNQKHIDSNQITRHCLTDLMLAVLTERLHDCTEHSEQHMNLSPVAPIPMGLYHCNKPVHVYCCTL